MGVEKKKNSILLKLFRYFAVLADREGFEPPIQLPVCRISSAVLSTAQPPVRLENQILNTGRKCKSDQIATGLPPAAVPVRSRPFLFWQ
jgi:hypothetical protein